MSSLEGWPRDRYTGRGGGLSKLPGGGLFTGPGGGMYSWPGGGMYSGPGGGLSKLPGGGLSTGPGGGLSTTPGGGLYAGPGGGLSTEEGGGLYSGPGGGLHADVCDKHYRSNQPPIHIFIEYLMLLGMTEIAELLRNAHELEPQKPALDLSNLHNKSA